MPAVAPPGRREALEREVADHKREIRRRRELLAVAAAQLRELEAQCAGSGIAVVRRPRTE